MNTVEHAQAHAEQQRSTTESWHRRAADPTLEAQARARAEEQRAKSEALQRSAEYRGSLPVNGGDAA